MERSGARGFTIIEVLTVVVIVGILASIALPAFQTMVASNRRVTGLNNFLASMHIARSEAITRNRQISVCRSNSAQTACVASAGSWEDGWLIFIDPDADGVFDAGETLLSTGDALRGNLSLTSAEFTFAMTFQPSGRVRASAGGAFGELALCEEGAATAVRMVIIDRTGRPRSSELALDGAAGECA